MEASTDLHELIHSMNRSEKRYFKLFAQMQGKTDNNYIQLFDAINKQKVYDEEALKQKFAKKIKQFGSTKFFLYKLILKSLRIAHSDDSIHYTIADQLREADLLIRRNLYDQAGKIIDKCIEVAEKYDFHSWLLMAYQEKQRIILQKGRTKNYLIELERICAKGRQLLKGFEEGLSYAELSAKFNYLSEMNDDQTVDSLQTLEELMQSELLQDESQATFFESQKMFYHIHTLYNYAQKNWEQMYGYAKKRVAIYEAQKYRIDHDPLAYIAALHNFMIACELVGEYEEQLLVLEKMRQVKVKRKDVQAKVLLQSRYFELNLYLKMKHRDAAQKTALQFREELNVLGEKIAYELLLNFHIQLIMFFLIAKDLDKSFEHLEYVQSYPHILKVDMTYRHLLILELLYHIAAGNDLLLPNKARSMYRYLQSQQQTDFEKSLIELARYRLPNAVNPKERKAMLQAWEVEVEVILEREKQVLPLFEHFDVVEWIGEV